MGFFDMFRPRDKPIADGVPGTAQVVSVSSYTGKGVYQSCHMNLVINAPNVTPTAVEFEGIVHNRLWPSPGSVLPITVNPADPTRYAILWEQVPNTREVAKSDAEGIAAALRGDPNSLAQLIGGGLLGGMGASNVQVIGDMSQITEDQKAKLRMFGLDPDALFAAAQGGAASFATVGVSTRDDNISRLERLTALRDKGTLTQAEFEAEKKKILGS